MPSERAPGWTRAAFGDVVRQVRDRVDPEESRLERYVAGEHMDTDDLRIRRWGLIGSGYLGPAFHMRFKPGNVLYGSRRTYLRKVAVADFEGITANTTFVIETKNPKVLLPELLPFIMQTKAFNEHSIKQSKGSVNPYINFSDLTWYEFALPPLEKQREIVNALSAAITLHEATKDLLLNALMMHRANMKQLQSSYYFEKVHVDSLLGRIVAGKSSVGVDTAPSDGEYGVIKVSAVDPRGFLPHESKRLLNPDDFNPDFSLHAGDLLITRANTPELVGEVCLVERDHANLMLCDKTLRLEPRAGVDPYLLWETLQGEDVRRQLKAAATGTGRAMKNISQPTIRSLKMPFPLDRRVADKARARLLASRKAARAIQGRVDRNKGLMHSLRERLLRQAER